MKVVCINDSNKPSKIPSNKWVEKGQLYTVRRIVRLPLQPDQYGFVLEEIELGPESLPYEFFSSDRFVPEEYHKDFNQEEVVEEADLDLV